MRLLRVKGEVQLDTVFPQLLDTLLKYKYASIGLYIVELDLIATV